MKEPEPERFSLAAKVVVVIGGGGVLGGAFCRAAGKAGASVAVLDLSQEAATRIAIELSDRGVAAIGLAVDATDRDQLQLSCLRVVNDLGGVDVLINAAGLIDTTDFFEISKDDWYRVIDANLTSVFLACQVFGRAMIDGNHGGSIINISSASSGPPLSRVFVYGVAKAGVNNLTQYLAREFAPVGIRVNAIAPGFFPTAQNRRVLSKDRVAAILGHTPIGRLGEPDDLVGTVLWLASGQASCFVTGVVIHVDGGFSAMTI